MIKMSEKILEIIESLAQIEGDDSVPKNVRNRIKGAITALQQEKLSLEIKKDKALQELDELDNNINIPTYTRTQIWDIVSSLESL